MKGSLLAALKSAYPEVEWKQEWLSQKKPRRYWKNTENQRTFMEEFAKKHQINQPSDWGRVSHRVLRNEGGRGLLHYHKGNTIAFLNP